jgi:hypothetical protein
VPELSPLSETIIIALIVAVFPTVVAIAAAFLSMINLLKANETLRRLLELENNQIAGTGRLIDIQSMLGRATELAIANQRMTALQKELEMLRKDPAS